MLTDIVFSHTDLDGAGAAIVFEHYFRDQKGMEVDKDYKIVHMSNGINDEIGAFVNGETSDQKLQYLVDLRNEADENTTITFCDIVCNQTYLERIIDMFKNVFVYDHHRTNLWVNDLPEDRRPGGIVKVSTFYEDKPVRTESGTSLAYEGITDSLGRNYNKLKEFSELVRIYDTFQMEDPRWEEAQMLNKIFQQIGMENFRKKYMEYFKNVRDIIDTTVMGRFMAEDVDGILMYDSDEIKPIIDPEIKSFINMMQDVETKKIQDIVNGECREPFNFEVVFKNNEMGSLKGIIFDLISNVNMSALSVEYLKAHPEYQVFGWFNMNSSMMSIRSIDDKYDVGTIAKQFGGGGHLRAAGMKIPKVIADAICKRLQERIE